MAYVTNYNSIATSHSMDKKTYYVNFKGLIKHLMDILFTQHSSHTYYVDELSGYIQKDIGIYK